MISTQYLVRLDLKYAMPYEKTERRLTKCHEALYSTDTVSVDSFDGNSCAAPYIEVAVENADQAAEIETQLKKIIGRWVDA